MLLRPTVLVALLLLSACDDKADDSEPWDGTSGTSDDTGGDDGGTTVPTTDEDHDDYLSDVDCDDHDYTVHPDAEELCDGKDNDCDGEIDEAFDVDEDGYVSAIECEDGTDCDDADPSISPGGTEIPYDGIDQDCDGADLEDADGDGWTAEVVGGNDCDDTDPNISPAAEEVAKDGIDQNCDGEDLLDGDGDGYDADDFGGDDCDDEDPEVHPGSFDYMNDGMDADCDGSDGALGLLKDIGITVLGTTSSVDLMGNAVAACDLDGDGFDELIVSAPFADSYLGEVYLFDGAGSASWGSGMTASDATATFTTTGSFLGFQVACGDMDGDGYLDLMLGRGDFYNSDSYSYLNADLGALIYYGDGTSWSGTVPDSDADATFSFGMGRESSYTVYSLETWLGDLDGDGKDELFVNMYSGTNSDLSAWDTDSSLWIVAGGSWSGDYSWDSVLAARIFSDTENAILGASVIDDLDGDGSPELVLHQGGWQSDTESEDFPGQATFLSGLPSAEWVAGDLAWSSVLGSDSQELGFAVTVGDYDGDGRVDGIFSAPTDATSGYEDSGALYFVSDLATALSGVGLAADDLATATVIGRSDSGFLGLRLSNVGDVNGDGMEDVLVNEPYGGTKGIGAVWLVSGALLSSTGLVVDDVALLGWDYESSYDASGAGQTLVGADFDGDGERDLVISARTAAASTSYTDGRIYVVLSSTH